MSYAYVWTTLAWTCLGVAVYLKQIILLCVPRHISLPCERAIVSGYYIENCWYDINLQIY